MATPPAALLQWGVGVEDRKVFTSLSKAAAEIRLAVRDSLWDGDEYTKADLLENIAALKKFISRAEKLKSDADSICSDAWDEGLDLLGEVAKECNTAVGYLRSELADVEKAVRSKK